MSDRVLIIAEAGVNHDGSLVQARALVDAALAAGADIVKFQTFRADSIATRAVGKAEYQKNAAAQAESQHAMLQRLELDEAAHADLIAYCGACGVEFLSTPFDLPSVALLTERHGLRRLKISSGDLTNGPLLLAAARSGAAIILSTGMGTLGEVEAALGVLAFGMTAPRQRPAGAAAFAAAYGSAAGQQALGERVTLLHCTSRYPAPAASVNLRAMATLREAFGLPSGYSDHTLGSAVAIAAAARGAAVIEKHFTLDDGRCRGRTTRPRSSRGNSPRWWRVCVRSKVRSATASSARPPPNCAMHAPRARRSSRRAPSRAGSATRHAI